MIEKIGGGHIPSAVYEGKDLKGVATEFEALFIQYMLKTMREGIRSGLFGENRGEEIYRSLFEEKVSLLIAEAGGIGIRDMLLRWFDENKG